MKPFDNGLYINKPLLGLLNGYETKFIGPKWKKNLEPDRKEETQLWGFLAYLLQ